MEAEENKLINQGYRVEGEEPERYLIKRFDKFTLLVKPVNDKYDLIIKNYNTPLVPLAYYVGFDKVQLFDYIFTKQPEKLIPNKGWQKEIHAFVSKYLQPKGLTKVSLAEADIWGVETHSYRLSFTKEKALFECTVYPWQGTNKFTLEVPFSESEFLLAMLVLDK